MSRIFLVLELLPSAPFRAAIQSALRYKVLCGVLRVLTP